MPRSQTIRQDSKVYTFTPGAGGSLTAPGTKPVPFFEDRTQHVSKVVPVLKARRKRIADAQVGATRG